MKVRELLNEVNLLPGLESKKIDISHWDPNVTDAYIITLNDGRKMLRFDRGHTINNEVVQFPDEDFSDFRVRVKKTIVDDAKRFSRSDAMDKKQKATSGGASDDRIYLRVPFRDKDYAKREFGARWNPQKKRWWVKSDMEKYIPKFKEMGWLD